jgi:hypothetical protein
MRMMEASLYPVIPHLYAERQNREKKSMSDSVQTDPRSKMSVKNTTIESRLMFCVCYVLFLFRAVLSRIMPWREQAFFRKFGTRMSIFREASCAASVMVASSFMGL